MTKKEKELMVHRRRLQYQRRVRQLIRRIDPDKPLTERQMFVLLNRIVRFKKGITASDLKVMVNFYLREIQRT